MGQTIKGWTNAMYTMYKGERSVFIISSDLAYGVNGNQGIPPNTNLIFDIELLDFQDQPDNNAKDQPHDSCSHGGADGDDEEDADGDDEEEADGEDISI